MTQAQKLTRRMTIPIVAAVVVAVFAVCASVALAGTPSTVAISSTTHPVQTNWYPSANPAFTWTAATESGGTIAGYSFVLDQNANTVPVASTGTASLSYLPKVNYTVGSTPAEDRVADLNGDGKPDLVVENSASNTVSVLIGNGDGTLKAAANYATGADPWSLAIGDVNGDGKLDLVVCDEAASTISVLLGNGDGTFQAHVDYTTGAGTSPESMRLGDFNGDGKLDVVTANAGTSNLSILLNQGNGTFGAPTTFGTDSHPTSIAVGDLNGDGKQDVVTANIDTSSVSVLMGNGNGTFQAAVSYACGSTPETVVLPDLNGDGHPDIATANYVSTASVLLNKGNGTFAAHVDYATGSGPYSLEAADMNHDGAVDLVTVNHAANSVSVLYGNGDGTLQAKTDLTVGNGPFWVALGDFNNDGFGDIAVTNYSDGTVSVLLGSAYFSAKTAARYSGQAEGVWYMHVRAVDTLGVGGTTATYTVNIDATPPVTTATGLVASAGSNWTNAPLVTIAATDALSKVAATYYTVDGGARQTYSAPFGVATSGSHTISYWSVDNAGNTETAHSGFVNVDLIKPVTIATGLAGTATSGWHTAATSFTLAASDAGNSGLATTNYTIDGGTSMQYTGAPVPVSGDAGHVITYWSTDLAGNVEDAHTGYINIDSKAPVTTAATAPSGWTNGPVQVTLTATDAGGSGVTTTYYQVGSGAQKTYTAPFAVSDATAIIYWSTDAAGNVEGHHTLTPQIDTVAPVTTAATAPSGWTNGPVQVTLTATDAGGSGVATTYYQVGSGAQKTYTAPFAVSDATAIIYWSTDAAGNVEGHHTLTPQIDTVAPVTTATTDPSGWTNGPVQVTLTATDAGGSGVATTYYQVGSGAQKTYTAPFAVSDSSTVTFWSTDKAGNEESHHTLTPQIDSQAPVTTATTDPSGWTNGAVKVTLAASDKGGSGLDTTWYQIGDGATKAYDTAFTVSDATQVSYWSTDKAGNEESHNTLTPRIDTQAPTASDDIAAGWQTGAQTVTMTTADTGGSGVAQLVCTVDGADQSLPPAGGSFKVTADGEHTISYYAVDAAGNQGDTVTKTLAIDSQAPVTTAATDPKGWTNGSVQVTLSADDTTAGIATSGIDTIWYQIGDGSATAYSGPITATDASQITYWSTDKAGNEEAHNTLTPQIDTQAPVTTAATDPKGWTNGAVKVTLAASDKGGSGLDTIWYQIGDGSATAYSGPITATDASQITYWSTDKAGNEEAHNTLTPQIDSQAPVTTATTDPSGWTNGAVKVTLAASDKGGSGLDTTWYHIGDGATKAYDTAFTVSDATQVSYWSTDKAGNEESHNTLTPRIDTQAPTASDDIAAGWQTGAQTVTVTTADTGGSGVAQLVCTVDGADQSLPPAGGSFKVTADGEHTISYYAVDAAGNQGDTVTKTLAIDSQAPVTTAATDPKGWTNGSVQVTLSADDTTAGIATSGIDTIWYQIGDGSATAYSGPITATDASQITYWSTDKAGNEEAPHHTLTPQIDTVAPVTTSADLAAGPAVDWQPSPASVTLSATDDQSGVDTTTFQIDGQTPQTYSGPITIADEGSHKVTFFSTDAVGNQEAPQVGYVNVDSVAPTSSAAGLQVDGATGWQKDAQSVTLTASDAVSGVTGGQAGIFYSLDGSTYSAYTGPFTVKTEGSNQVWYYAVDAAGNLETAHSGFVNIDTTPPVTTASGLVDVNNGDFTNHSQQVTLTAADSGSGVKGGDAATWYTDTVGDATPTALPYTGPFTVTGVGSHTITYYSIDALGNVEPTEVGYVNIAPDQALVTLASGLAADGHSGWLTTGTANVSLSTSGGGGTITTQYRVNGGQWLAYTGPFSVTGDGSHRVDYRSSDNVGDAWSLSTGYVNIDTVGPATIVAGPTTPQRATTTVRFSGTDAVSGYSTTVFKVDTGAWTAGATAVVKATADHKADGVHTITYHSMDVAGNEGPTGQVKVTIDTRRPVLTLRGATKVTVRKGRYLALRYRSVDTGGACKLVLTFTRKVHKKVVTTTFTISAKRVTKWQSSKLRLNLTKGAYTVKLQLRDLAGNLSTAKTMHVTVK